jgi:hypothetical protein
MDAEILGHARLGDVGIDQQHGAIHFHRHRNREVDRTETLALARQRTGDHDEIAVLDPRGALAERIGDERALDDAEFLGDLALLGVRRDHAHAMQPRQVDRLHLTVACQCGRIRDIEYRFHRGGDERRGMTAAALLVEGALDQTGAFRVIAVAAR